MSPLVKRVDVHISVDKRSGEETHVSWVSEEISGSVPQAHFLLDEVELIVWWGWLSIPSKMNKNLKKLKIFKTVKIEFFEKVQKMGIFLGVCLPFDVFCCTSPVKLSKEELILGSGEKLGVVDDGVETDSTRPLGGSPAISGVVLDLEVLISPFEQARTALLVVDALLIDLTKK